MCGLRAYGLRGTCFVSSQNPLIGALLPRRADIVDDCEAKLVELQYLDVPVR